MRIGFVTYEFPSPTQTFILDKVKCLLAQGHEVIIFVREKPFTIRQRHALHENYKEINWRKRTINLGQEEAWGTLRKAASLLQRLGGAFLRSPGETKQLLSRLRLRGASWKETAFLLLTLLPIIGRKLDLLHVHFTWSGFGLAECPVLLDLPLVVSVYGADAALADNWINEQNIKLFAAAEAVFCVSAFRMAALARLGVEQRKLIVQRLAVDTELFQPARDRAADDGPPIVLTVARLRWEKSHLDGLFALRELKGMGLSASYLIIGEGEEEQRLRTAVRGLGLHGQVQFLGFQTQASVAGIMRKAHVFLLPSVLEEFGTVLLEAQASGLPVVATNIGGIPEAVFDGVSGKLVRPQDPLALAKALRDILVLPDQGREMGRRGRDYVRRRFSQEQAAKELVQHYQNAVNSRRSRLQTLSAANTDEKAFRAPVRG